jgi:hypothetical protein
MSPISPADIDAAIDSGVGFLGRRQLPHGQFRASASPTPDLSGAPYGDSCVFVTALVAHSLTLIGAKDTETMQRRCFEFLLSEMRPDGRWSYWTGASGLDIGPDMDDTSICSFVLRRHAPEVGKLNRADVLANRSAEGLFQTWFRASGNPNDVDSVVNANVLLHLGPMEETRPVAEALARLVVDGREADTSWYYPDTIALLNAIARALAHGVLTLEGCRRAVVERIRERQRADGSFGDALATGLGLAALLYAGCTELDLLKPAAACLLRARSPEGSWPRCVFYTGPEAPAPRSVWFGSEDLTTATAIEALDLLRRAIPGEAGHG